jgi:hypothetical protein
MHEGLLRRLRVAGSEIEETKAIESTGIGNEFYPI